MHQISEEEEDIKKEQEEAKMDDEDTAQGPNKDQKKPGGCSASTGRGPMTS